MERNFKLTEIAIESIAAEVVIQRQGSDVAVMNEKEFKNEKLYQTTMSLVRKMFIDGIISEKEYCQIDTIFIEKYQPI